MNNVTTIKSSLIADAISYLCQKAACFLREEIYNALQRFNCEEILLNAHLAYKTKRPICQDTGITVVFVDIGQDVHIEGDELELAINKGVEKGYEQGYLRKSIVDDPVYARKNTETNTPAVIHTRIVPGNTIKITVALKGAGSENMSAVKMLNPSDGVEGIINFVVETVENSASNSCPPVYIGIGVGGTMEQAAILAKRALLKTPLTESELEKQIYEKVKDIAFGVSIETQACHIAGLPVAINLNCHATRHAEMVLTENTVLPEEIKPDFDIPCNEHKIDYSSYKKINLPLKDEDIEGLKAGDGVLLSGEVCTARDAAHKKFIEQGIPFDIKGQVIYYTGPCPAMEDEIIGPAGPTTSSRMDSYTPQLLELGLKGMIGKGIRNQEVLNSIKQNKAVYFTAIGGAACLLTQKIKSAKIIAYHELGTEAVFKLQVEDFPVIVNFI
ncbi:MAG: hypothetical protein A2Y25_07275 [Candidatus Melainabacteria bacterium GWF2_37_15]|nr:MAG: hypothetical protein A2Y25_07275 [Candidatus Melainabacteria bacterium GWF2_37_15]